ncbi:MAG: hypothetical protein KC466_04485 [Myxococcales bacterium]|nr:hypothetical protein [Myxococcales bacterium]
MVAILAAVLFAATGASRSASDESTDPKAPVVLLFGGDLRGRLEPCGCSEGLLGGLPRRLSYARNAAARGSVVIGAEVGELTPPDRLDRQSALQAETALDLLAAAGTRVLAAGAAEWTRGLEETALQAADRGITLIASNAPPGSSVADLHTVEARVGPRTLRVAFAAFADPGIFGDGARPAGLAEPTAALSRLLPRLRAAGDWRVVLVAGSLEEARKLAAPGIDLIVAGHGEDLDGFEGERVGDTLLVTFGALGKALGRVDLTFPEPQGPPIAHFRWVPLTGDYKDDAEAARALDVHQEALAAERLVERHPKVPHPDGRFVGSDACASCHPGATKRWRASGHARAYETLVTARRTADPTCVACHVVGLDFTSGFTDPAGTATLKGVGCESCHGPGASHIAMPSSPYGPADARNCAQCHNAEHDRSFRFDEAWARITHR